MSAIVHLCAVRYTVLPLPLTFITATCQHVFQVFSQGLDFSIRSVKPLVYHVCNLHAADACVHR